MTDLALPWPIPYQETIPGPTGAEVLAPWSGGPRMAEPTVSTGQTPGLAIDTGAAPGLPVGAQPTLTNDAISQQLRAQLAGTPAPAGPQGMDWRRALGLAILGAGDAAGSLAAVKRGQRPSGESDMLKGLALHQQGQQEAARAVQADRQWRGEMITKIAAMDSHEWAAHKAALEVVTDAAKNPQSTLESRQAAFQRAIGIAAKAGWAVKDSERIYGAVIQNPELATALGKWFPVFNEKDEADKKNMAEFTSRAIALNAAGPEGAAKVPALAEAYGLAKVVPGALTTAMEAAQSIKRTTEYTGGPIPLEDVLAHARTKYGPKLAPLYEEVLLGLAGPKDQVGKALAMFGIQSPDTAQAAQQAGAVDQAKLDVETDPGNVGKRVASKNQELAGTRLEQAATEASQTTARKLGELNPTVVAAEGAKREGEKAQDLRFEERKKALEARFAQTNPADDAQVSGLRREFTSASQTFVDSKSSYQQVRSGAQSKNAQGDVTLVYGFVKLLDPSSVVREGEYATARKTAGLFDWFAQAWEKVKAGDILSDEQRAKFLEQAGNVWAERSANQREIVSEFSRLAKKNRIDPERVIVDYFGREGIQTAVPAADRPKSGRPIGTR